MAPYVFAIGFILGLLCADRVGWRDPQGEEPR